MTPAEQHLSKVHIDLRDAQQAMRNLWIRPDGDPQSIMDVRTACEALTRAIASTALAVDLVAKDLTGSAQAGVSSVELEQNSKSINVKVKVYADSPIQPAGDAALAELDRLINAVRAGQARDWQATVDHVQGGLSP